MNIAKNNETDPHPDVAQYATQWKMRDGTPVTLRPICPEDEPLMVRFHETLSESSVRYRYFGELNLGQRISHERLARICSNDSEREFALVADHLATTGEHEIVGVGQLSRAPGSSEAEFSVLITDVWQGRGLGAQLLKTLVEIGRSEKLKRIIGHILPDNVEMHHVAKRVGFRLKWEQDEWFAELDL